MHQPTSPIPLVCPVADVSYFESAASMVFRSGYDTALPFEDRLFKLAGVAVGFGLRVGCDYPEEVAGLLGVPAESAGSDPQCEGDAESFVASFAAAAEHGGLVESVRLAGAPLLAVLVLLLVKHAQNAEPPAAERDERTMAQSMTRIFLRSVLHLTRKHPDLANRFRSLVPG